MAFQTPAGELALDDDDICWNCNHITECPIIHALDQRLFVITGGQLHIDDCIFYDPHKPRHLKVVRGDG